jgi:hypothetical protein
MAMRGARWIPVRALISIALASGCIVTQPPKLDQRPRWYLQQGAALDADCLLGNAFVRKSGKQGIGLALQLRSRHDCTVSIDTVRVAFAKTTVEVPAIAPMQLRGRSQIYAWLPVPFDNNTAWNRERNHATLELALRINGKPVTWALPMEQR